MIVYANKGSNGEGEQASEFSRSQNVRREGGNRDSTPRTTARTSTTTKRRDRRFGLHYNL